MIDRKIIDELHANNHTLKGTSFSLAMRNEDDSITVYKRENQPCMGELRTYGEGSVPPERAKDRRPGDLRAPFPKGTPEAVGVPIKCTYSSNIANHNQYFEYVFGPESPWRKGLKGIEFTDDKQGRHIGIVSTDTDFDPTVFVSCLKFARFVYGNKGDLFDKYLKDGMDKFLAFIVSSTVSGSMFHGVGGLYTPLNLKMMKNGEPKELSGGLTFRQRSAYNRPQIETLFQDPTFPTPTGKTSEEIVTKIKELLK
jgi:hypothetical protein